MEQQLRELRKQLEKQYLKNGPPVDQQGFGHAPESSTIEEADTARKTRSCQIVPEPLLNSTDLQVPKTPKSNSEIRQIIKAIHVNDFLRRLDELQVSAMVACFRSVDYGPRETVISEGSVGTSMYIVAEGELLVTQCRRHQRTLSTGDVFGELAILYNCKRTATVKAIGQVKLWEIHRQTFRTIMAKNSRQRRQDTLRLLKETRALKGLSDTQLSRIIDSMEECKFLPGDVIARDDGKGTAFYIILRGEVQVTQRENAKEELTGILSVGDYFGELSPLLNTSRTTTHRAVGEVTCITMTKEDFEDMYPFDAVESCDMDSPTNDVLPPMRRSSSGLITDCLSKPLRLKDLEPVLYQEGKHAGMPVTLGAGGYGRVELVTCGTWRPGTFLALKKISKEHVIRTRQQEHVRTERRVLQRSRSPFIVRLFQTFKDSRYVYLALEFCEGGELWTKLREVKRFHEEATVFCCACVVEALDYLHANGVIYRDLKPENLMMDQHGYVKLVDFGFVKELRKGEKTYTFCGTPEYLAPEILHNEGHDFAVDFWMLGILAFEMMVGRPRPGQRLGNTKNGIRGLKKHRWFNKLNWKKLSARQLEAPTVSLIKQGPPYVNFRRYSIVQCTAEEEFSGWDEDF
ncbi:cGMP-dependent protein kinase 2-like isoform X2 [Ambystoma mexicanum]|uniref:cGMP-dependent protein kinase 2-like isoform X2 n=1 Tax=Ambystoma mexicanum TaxID=8296 RepID=UPI0037E7BC0D